MPFPRRCIVFAYTISHRSFYKVYLRCLCCMTSGTLGNRKVDLFGTGAGFSSESTAEENVQMSSSISNQELVDAGMKRMDETDQAIEHSKQVVHQTVEIDTQTAANLKGQADQMGRVGNDLDTIQFSIKKASQLVKEIERQVCII
ncbi:hypothetical protein Bca4012_092177 [Brassica carinata]